ncbi:hypothetical protein BDN72DRAFT_958197 [Pluteus cervinus]|uniref:Uncharacterized protein n=1 Tax=Pluteus cervinus TaxID=181527 RepID=A0ACD3AZY3_9AGAR|nr:hypothetical protein BDN72DRAFT_958197 [Pluteus cervinus]
MVLVEQSPMQDTIGLSLTGLTLDAAYAKIKVEIRRSRDHIRNLKHLHNSISPISRLPDELLCIIMDTSYRQCNKAPRTRLAFSWVCKHWRYVALGNPQLWRLIRNYPPSINGTYTQECIIRSKNLALEVDLRSPPAEVLRLCLTQNHRIRSLSYTPPVDTEGLQLNLLWGRPVPQLSSLVLTRVSLSAKLFDGIYPMLKSLELTRCKFDWGFPLSASNTLTTLLISYPSRSIPGDLLAERLSKMPHLTDLRLTSCLEPETLIATGHIFRSLRSLYVRDFGLKLLVGFLANIEAPKLSSIHACIEQEPNPKEEELSVTLYALRILQPSLWNDIRHLIIRPRAIEVQGSSPGFKGKIIFPRCPNYHNSDRSLPFLYDKLPIDHLETLSVEAWYNKLPETVGRLESVKTLRFNKFDDKITSDLLTRVQGEKGQRRISLPSLTEIHCDNPSEWLYGVLEKRRKILQKPLPKLTFCSAPQTFIVDRFRFGGIADLVAADGVASIEYLDVHDDDE